MSENPYQSPTTDETEEWVPGILSGKRDDLRKVAKYQKGILVCILINLIALVLQYTLPREFQGFVGLGMICAGLAGTVFVFLLAMKVYSTGRGVLLGILALIPLIGLFVLLAVNGKATAIMRQNRIHVGLLGANLSQI